MVLVLVTLSNRLYLFPYDPGLLYWTSTVMKSLTISTLSSRTSLILSSASSKDYQSSSLPVSQVSWSAVSMAPLKACSD